MKKKNKPTEQTIEIEIPSKPAAPHNIAEHGALIADLLLNFTASETDRAMAVAFAICGDSEAAAFFAGREAQRERSEGKCDEPDSSAFTNSRR